MQADNGSASSRQGARKVAIYIRVSTVYQIDKDSLPMQRKDLIAYSELILGIPDYEIFEDAGYSGKNTDRPALQEMMSRIREKEFSHLLVWKIDRISRNLLDFSEMYMELKKLHVIFVSKNENFDTSTAMGEAMLKIILVFAELERNMTSERVTATMISRANQGQWNGGRIPFGYDYDPVTETFSIREDEAAICRSMKDDYLQYHSLIHTTRFLNSQNQFTRQGVDWSPTTVWIILSNPFYAGIYRYNKFKGNEGRTINPEEEWVVIPDHHPAIFTVAEYEKMKIILKENARKQNTTEQNNIRKNVHVFGGICFCEKCGSRMVSTPGRLQVDGYRTSTYTCSRKRKTKDCDNPAVNDLIIGDFVMNYIANIIKAKRTFSAISSPEELQKTLLHGGAFVGVSTIEGIEELYDLLSLYPSDKSFRLVKSRKKKEPVNPEISALKKDRDRNQRALSRLQDLFLYSEASMSQKDFVIRKQEITARIDAINEKLRLLSGNPDNSLSDEEFIRRASYLLITSRLQDAEFIYYKKLASETSPEVLQQYVGSIIERIYLDNGHVSGISFRNGIYHKFIRK